MDNRGLLSASCVAISPPGHSGDSVHWHVLLSTLYVFAIFLQTPPNSPTSVSYQGRVGGVFVYFCHSHSTEAKALHVEGGQNC